jgi:hypothetical protein
MKYIITENQHKRIMNRMSEILNYEFEKTNIVCGVTVQEVDEEEFDYEVDKGLKYDIFVTFNEKFTRAAGIHGFKVATERKIRKLLRDWFGLDNYEYYISSIVKDC